MSRVILITGASTGIGAETARVLAPGNEIFVHYNTSKEKAEGVAKDVEERGGKAYLLQADLTREEECIKLVDEVSKKVPRLDVLVNNAGGLIRRQSVRELEWSLMLETFALNTFSVMKISSLCIPLLEKSDSPCIVNITSIAMRHGGPTATIYAASKAAIDSFTRGMAREVAPKIRVNAVAPGVIETPFHEKVSTPEQLEKWREDNPLKRNGKPYHIALTIKFIIENDFLNGETIDVNGGLFMR
ncbi:SDR family oxidoreductase [Candidatus Aerophobetes bacterium]|nr:SDR family oxidoreductase [Candidatus Aerophobetes bacterium]